MLKLNFNPFPQLSTERLLLKHLTINDAEEIYILRSSEQVNKFLDRPISNSIDDAVHFIEKISESINNNEAILWGIYLKEEDKFAGTICFWNISPQLMKAEIGYEMLPLLQGKGIMNEAMYEVIKYGFEDMKLTTIEADLDHNNLASVHLLQKHNFIKLDIYSDEEAVDNNNRKTVVYSLTSK